MNDITKGNTGDVVDDFATIADVSIQSANNIVNPNQVRSGVTRGIQQLGSDKVYSDGGNNQIIVEDLTVPRVMMGNHATFGEGFFVSKDGFNVKTSTDPANFIFRSSNNIFKIVKVVPMSVTLNYVAGAMPNATVAKTSTTAHSLTFIPTPLSNIVIDASIASQSGYPPSIYYGNSANVPGYVGNHITTFALAQVSVDATNVYFQVLLDATGFTNGNYTFTAAVYLQQETFTGS